MKKENLLSKKEMKKITGGDPDPNGLCFPAWYCIDALGALVLKKPVPDCSTETLFGACYIWDEINETRTDVDFNQSYCDSCN
ncbi:hypothetical protein [Pedobacter sp. UC225_65]|uniref:hypothetical protein n=1 Tax=Pedobacter sp. UC225_65 TaxID=3350173 RepID=UPI003671F8F9